MPRLFPRSTRQECFHGNLIGVAWKRKTPSGDRGNITQRFRGNPMAGKAGKGFHGNPEEGNVSTVARRQRFHGLPVAMFPRSTCFHGHLTAPKRMEKVSTVAC